MLAIFVSMLTLGLVTSIHCVSMCGPMVVSYAVKGEEGGPWFRKLIPNLAYQGAKIVSYVIVGLALGAIGSAFNIDGARPYIMLVAGGFMIVMGLGMTGKFPWAARLSPRPPKFLMKALSATRRRANADAEMGESSLATPIVFGLLTGLMPCAPLMAAQLAAAGTGSVLGGGLAMLAFGLGTAPLMLVFGTASSMLPADFKKKMMSALAIVVIIFGGVYVNRAAMRLGSPVTFNTVKQVVLGTPAAPAASTANYNTAADGVVEVPLTIANVQFSPANLQIPADKPVRLVVNRQEANACSDQLSIPQLGITVNLAPNAVTTVDIPATKSGAYTLTCGMGMMSGQLSVGTAVASAGGAGSPMVWLIFTIACAAAALWVARGVEAGPATVPAHAASAKAATAKVAAAKTATAKTTTAKSAVAKSTKAASTKTTAAEAAAASKKQSPKQAEIKDAEESVSAQLIAGLKPKHLILLVSVATFVVIVAFATGGGAVS